MVLAPKKGLTEEKESRLMESLQAKKAGLSKEEIEKIITETRELEEFQKTPSTQEEFLFWRFQTLIKIRDLLLVKKVRWKISRCFTVIFLLTVSDMWI